MIRETRSGGRNSWKKSMWLPMLLTIGAVLLFSAAIAMNKEEEVKQYIPLNEAVEQALAQLEDNSTYTSEPNLTGTTAKLEQSMEQSETHSVRSEKTTSSADSQEQIEGKVTEINEETNEKNFVEKDNRVDINRASLSELQTLKGIGPSKANAILLEREKNGFFRTPEDLLRVKGIGNKLLLEIKESIVARP